MKNKFERRLKEQAVFKKRMDRLKAQRGLGVNAKPMFEYKHQSTPCSCYLCRNELYNNYKGYVDERLHKDSLIQEYLDFYDEYQED